MKNENYAYDFRQEIEFSGVKYYYYPGLDSSHGDIEMMLTSDIKDMSEICNENPHAIGFNSNGWLKSSIKSNLRDWDLHDIAQFQGTYVKKEYIDEKEERDIKVSECITNCIQNCTLITCLYNLAVREDHKERRSIEEYKQYADYVLTKKNYMIIFCDSELKDYIREKRQSFGLLEKTYIISDGLEKLETYNYLKYIENNFKTNRPIDYDRRKRTPLYTILTNAKFDMILKGIELDPFKTSHFGWIDIGVSHVDNTTNIGLIGDKIRLTCIFNTTKQELEDLNSFYTKISYKIAFGYCTGKLEYMHKMSMLAKEEFIRATKLGFSPLEEHIISYLYCTNRDLFEPYYGDYQQCISNYEYLCENKDIVFRNLRYCLQTGDTLEIENIKKYIKESANKGLILNEEQIRLIN